MQGCTYLPLIKTFMYPVVRKPHLLFWGINKITWKSEIKVFSKNTAKQKDFNRQVFSPTLYLPPHHPPNTIKLLANNTNVFLPYLV